MANDSDTDAKSSLPRLIDEALPGEEVVNTQLGKPPLRASSVGTPAPAYGSYEWLIARRDSRKSVAITSVDLLNDMYEEQD